MITKICWALLGLIHAVPALALFRPALLARMYGIDAASDIHTLMQHRAALFLVIVIISFWTMARSEVRPQTLLQKPTFVDLSRHSCSWLSR
jgi:hypothetical protein